MILLIQVVAQTQAPLSIRLKAGADPDRALCRRRLSLPQQGVLSHLVQGGVEVGISETEKIRK